MREGVAWHPLSTTEVTETLGQRNPSLLPISICITLSRTRLKNVWRVGGELNLPRPKTPLALILIYPPPRSFGYLNISKAFKLSQ